MARKRHIPEQIIQKRLKAGVEPAKAQPIADVLRKLVSAEQTDQSRQERARLFAGSVAAHAP